MKKKLFSVCAMLSFALCSAWAGEALHVHTVTGGEFIYEFADKPVVTFTATDMVLTTSTTTVNYPISQLKEFSFSNDGENGIESITVKEPNQDATTSIYSIDGVLLKKIEAVDGTTNYSLNDLPAGTYIIKSSTRTYKITKK